MPYECICQQGLDVSGAAYDASALCLCMAHLAPVKIGMARQAPDIVCMVGRHVQVASVLLSWPHCTWLVQRIGGLTICC